MFFFTSTVKIPPLSRWQARGERWRLQVSYLSQNYRKISHKGTCYQQVKINVDGYLRSLPLHIASRNVHENWNSERVSKHVYVSYNSNDSSKEVMVSTMTQ